MLKWNFRSFVSCRLTNYILVLAVVAVFTPPAFCRDDGSETYPNEITVKELERYGRWLNLSESQQVTVRAMHQAYLEKFATLQAEEIEPHSWPSAKDKTIAEFFKLADAYWDGTEIIRNKIRRVDGALLNEIMDILDESQLPVLQRVRDCRALQTLRVAPMISVTQRPLHDVTKFAYDMELSEADAALLDPILQSYERRLLSLSRPLHEKAFKQETSFTREFIRRGFGDEQFRESPDEWLATKRDVWGDLGSQIMDLILDIDKLNETTTRRVEQTLSHEGVQAWLDEFMTRSYHRANLPRLKRRPLMKALDQAGPLPARDETVFGELLLAFDISLRRVERRMIELDLKTGPRVYYFNVKDLLASARAASDEHKDDLDQARKELETLVDRFMLQLEQSLSPGGFAKWDAAYAVATERKSTYTQTTHADGRNIQSVRWASIFFEPRDLRRFTRIFGLNEEQHAVLQEAFRAYGKRKTAIETDFPKEKPVKPGWDPYLPANLRDRLRQSDEIVLSALVRQLADESEVRKVDWLRNARQRKRLGSQGYITGAGSVDLVLFILDSDLATEEIDTLSPLIEAYDAQAVGIYERQLTTYTTHYEWMIDNRDDESRIFPHMYAWRQTQSEVAKLNADTMFAIGEQLDSEAGTAMMELFKRYCYGPVFKDPDRADPILNRASRVEDLAASQRESLLDLKVLFLEEYERLTDAMLDDAKYTLSWFSESMTDTSHRQSPSDNREAYKRHRFLRDELNASTIVKLRTILTEEQIEALGGLPKK